MADFETIQERNISGKGMLRVPSEFSKSRLRILYCSVIRPPSSPYYNLSYSPYRSRYAFLTFSRNGYVVGQGAMEFEKQSFDGVTDITSQNLIAIKCAYDGLLQSFVNLTNALAATPGGLGLTFISVTDAIKDYEYLNLAWDEVRVVCYGDTAVNLKLVALPHDKCADDKDKPRKPPPPPPPPPPVPPGTPLTNLDPPYGGFEDEDNFTEFYPGDGSEDSEFPAGETCQRLYVQVKAYGNWATPEGEEPGKGKYVFFQKEIFGKLYGIINDRSSPAIFLDCGGDDTTGCVGRTNILVYAGEPSSPEYADAEIDFYYPI